MRKSKYLLETMALGVAVLFGASVTANATIVLQYTDTGTYAQAGFQADSASYINGNELIGIYHFNVNPALPSEFYSVCLDPAGLLDRSWHVYTTLSFQQANPGIFPSAWKSGTVGSVTEYWGIQNASYLWNTYGLNIVNNTGNTGHQNERAAALEFAIWSALYNSTAYGAMNTGTGVGVWHPNGLDSTIQDYFDTYVTGLNNTHGNIPLYTGDILRGTGYNESGQQQEFLALGTPVPFSALGTPVPEPTTMIAGALLLLPFGASTLRFVRKNRAA